VRRTAPVSGLLQASWLASLALLASACVTTPLLSQARVDMDRARSAPDVRDAAALAPHELEHAEDERAQAHAAAQHGDDMAADLHAERALVAYQRAVVLARLARATTAGEAARTSLAKQEMEAQRLAAARVDFERQADATANELAVARDAAAPVHIGPADAARERARLLTARSLSAEAHLLCGAARLLARSAPADAPADTHRLEVAERRDATLQADLAPLPLKGVPTPLETAARVRAACLDALTHARRSVGGASSGDADALLSALSARGGWDPSRDERGVVVTLRGAFKGTTLLPDADRQLRELGRVAAAHPSFPVQVVLHDAAPPSAAERIADVARAQAALGALTGGGAAASQAAAETEGASLPTTDPADPRTRPRNARLEIVFVSRTD